MHLQWNREWLLSAAAGQIEKRDTVAIVFPRVLCPVWAATYTNENDSHVFHDLGLHYSRMMGATSFR